MQAFQSKIDLVYEQKQLYEKVFCKKDGIWKIIVFDKKNLDIVSTLLKVKDFKENNITLYFSINQAREKIHGVSVIYLLTPNHENIQLIVQDFQDDLYSSVIIHFSAKPSAFLLSQLAKSLSKIKSAVSKVQKVQFSNIGFQCIDRQMCILPEEADLLNLLSVLKAEPIFIYAQSEQEKVNSLKEKFLNKNFDPSKMEPEQSNSKKPKKYTKVLIFNRQNDIYPIVGHGITYASLMQDVWKFNQTATKILNKKQQINLNDQIWLDKKNMLMSEMELEKQLNKIKAKIMSLNNKTLEFSELPEQQKRVQWHLNNVSEIIGQAKSRRLNQYHTVEEDLYINKTLSRDNKKEFIELLRSGPNPEDKIRLMLTYLACSQNYDQNQVQELEEVFPSIKKHKFYTELKAKRMKNESQQNANSKYIKKLAKGIWKNLINQEKKYLVVKYVQKTKELSKHNLAQLGLKITYLAQPPENSKIEHSVVYCLGGVCFNEYANLAQFDPTVIYTGDRFLNYRDLI